MAAWYDVQANPERMTTVGNAALVSPGAAEVEGGAELALGRTVTLTTPLRVKLGLYPNLQIHFSSEGFLVRPDLQRLAGVGAGLKVALLADPDGFGPYLAGRLDAWSPFPAPADDVARMQAELVASHRWGNLGLAASAGGDFAAGGASGPMAGVAMSLHDIGSMTLLAEGRYRSGLGYGGVGAAWTLGPLSTLDFGAGVRTDGSFVARAGFTRAFALDP